MIKNEFWWLFVPTKCLLLELAWTAPAPSPCVTSSLSSVAEHLGLKGLEHVHGSKSGYTFWLPRRIFGMGCHSVHAPLLQAPQESTWPKYFRQSIMTIRNTSHVQWLWDLFHFYVAFTFERFVIISHVIIKQPSFSAGESAPPVTGHEQNWSSSQVSLLFSQNVLQNTKCQWGMGKGHNF